MELLVLYDSRCPFCVRCAAWLAEQPAVSPLSFLCCRSEAAQARFGHIHELVSELVVVETGEGGGRYWAGPSAFVMCLFALEDTRFLAEIVGSALVWWVAHPFFRLVSDHRGLLSNLVGAPCHDGACTTVHRVAPYR